MEGDGPKLPESGWKTRSRHPEDKLFLLTAIGDQLRKPDHRQVLAFRHAAEVLDGRVVTAFVHEVGQDRHGRQSGEPRQIDSGFGMTGPSQHAAFARLEGLHRSGRNEIPGSQPLIRESAYRRGHAARRVKRDARLPGVHRRRPIGAGVRWVPRLARDQRDSQVGQALMVNAHVDRPVTQIAQAVERLSRHKAAGRDNVGLQAAPFGDYDHRLAFAEATDRFFDVRIHVRVILRPGFQVFFHRPSVFPRIWPRYRLPRLPCNRALWPP